MAKTKKNKKGAKKTYVGIVIDRSGSMSSCRDIAWKGLNEQIKTIKQFADKGGETFVTLVQFDDVFEILRDNEPAKEIHEIDYSEYRPRGSTALLDAVGRTIGMLETHETTDDTGFLVLVISDGQENASKEWVGDKLKNKIKELEATDKWTFTYMLSNVDVHQMVTKLGASPGNMASYTSSPVGSANAFGNLSLNSANYMSSRAKGLTSTPDYYNNAGSVSNIPADVTITNTVTPPVTSTITLSADQQKEIDKAVDILNKALNK